MDRIPLLGLTPPALCLALGADLITEPEARRVLAWLVSEGRPDLEGMARPVHKALRERLRSQTRWDRPAVVERVEDEGDGSVRYLFALADGKKVEAVRIPLHKPGCFSVCLSSQVGCAMGCVFCATGRLGLDRNLSAHEIVGCFLAVRDEAPGRVTGAVFMGQGEPFHNYDAVIAAAQVLSHPCGGRVRAEGISISTVGLLPSLQRYAEEGHPYRLFVSLTSAVAEKRLDLLPVAGRSALPELAAVLRRVAARSGDRVTLAWVLMKGINTGPDEVEALQAHFGDLPMRLNLIDVNDSRPGGFERADDDERNAFIDALQVLRAPVVRRFSVGRGRASACGMLAAEHTSVSP